MTIKNGETKSEAARRGILSLLHKTGYHLKRKHVMKEVSKEVGCSGGLVSLILAELAGKKEITIGSSADGFITYGPLVPTPEPSTPPPPATNTTHPILETRSYWVTSDGNEYSQEIDALRHELNLCRGR